MQPQTEQYDILGELREQAKHPKRKQRKAKEEVKRTNYKAVILTFLIVTAVIFSGTMYGLEQYAKWRTYNEWQFPAKWIGLVRAIEVKAFSADTKTAEVKVLTDIETIEQYYLAPYIKSIYMLESTKGQKDGCKDEGKFNGYGYRQNSSEWKCYDSFAEVTEKVNEWLEDRLSTNGKDIIEAVCFYNKGIQGLRDCGDYSANFSSVLTDNL